MESLFDFSRQIASLKKAKDFEDALNYFKENKKYFTKEQIRSNEYIISDIITCLRHTKKYEAGFKFLQIYDISIDTNQHERILNSYGWLLWSKYKIDNSTSSGDEEETMFFNEDEDEEISQTEILSYEKNTYIGLIESLMDILIQINSDFSRTLISNLFSVVLKTEKKKPNPNWKLVKEFCDHFNPSLLSKACSTIEIERKGKKREMELASDFENWYAFKSKALMKLGEWQDCFSTSVEALENIERFHYSNDIWFSRRVALSKKKLGNTEDTIQELENILKRKQEWFIQKELAELYFEKDEIDIAFQMAIGAVNNYGPIEFKVDLLFLLGQILNKQKQNSLAFKHFSLAKLIRENEEWKIPQKLLHELSQFSENEFPFPEIDGLKDELFKYWSESANKNKGAQKPKSNADNLIGKVTKILHDNDRGKNGFVKCEKDEHYFSASQNYHLTSKIVVGSKVVFKILPSKDGKKKIKITKIID